MSVFLVCLVIIAAVDSSPAADVVKLRLTIQSPLPYPNTPMDPWLDLEAFARQAEVGGIPDPQSVQVINADTGDIVPCALSDDFQTSSAGRVEFVIRDPRHRQFEVTFTTVPSRGPPQSKTLTPQIGNGDLLRFNAGVPRPVTVPYSPGLIDLNGDGHADLTGSWNYARRPGEPWDGVVCRPGLSSSPMEFGDLHRLRFRTERGGELQPLSHRYMGVAFADFNGDTQPDAVITRRGTRLAEFFLNTGERELSGMPQFVSAGSASVSGWQTCHVVDLNNDSAMDLIVDGAYVRNRNPDGWPFDASEPVRLNAGHHPCFLDIDGDGWDDAVCLHKGNTPGMQLFRLAWRRHLRTDPPSFSDEYLLEEIPFTDVSAAAPWQAAGGSGLIVQHRAFQRLTVCDLMPSPAADDSERGRFHLRDHARSVSAEMSLSDQAWPCLCDWDSDGDFDLLVGGGYGWPRVVINDGTRRQPAFRSPVRLKADGEPIRLLRNELLGDPPNTHNMGYSYPVFADWDADGLRDLICPNETNRLYWFRNTGTADAPQFAARRQILCDGYPDSESLRSQSNRRANDPQSNNGVYPYEQGRPFFWRTGAAIADFNGDGLLDLITHDGETRVATLFVQYRDDQNKLRLRKEMPLMLSNGQPLNDAVVSRKSHWTESFRAVDWNQDGLQDLIYSIAGAHGGSQDQGSIYLLLNAGTRHTPLFTPPRTMCCFGEPIRITNHGPHPWPGDFDGDGRPDLIACVEWSVYPWYSYAALMMDERPDYSVELIDGSR